MGRSVTRPQGPQIPEFKGSFCRARSQGLGLRFAPVKFKLHLGLQDSDAPQGLAVLGGMLDRRVFPGVVSPLLLGNDISLFSVARLSRIGVACSSSPGFYLDKAFELSSSQNSI